MKKVNMIIDVAKCHDCNDCFIACKDEHCGNEHLPIAAAQQWRGHRWMNLPNLERGQYPLNDVAYLPLPCMHCEDPACMKAAPDAIYKRPDGAVIIDPVKAKGRKEILGSCPYGVIYWNEEKQIAQKCTMCAHLLDQGWKEPRCVHACPTGSLTFLMAEDSDMAKVVSEQKLEDYHPEYGLKPRVHYKNLYRFTKCHVAGSVALADKNECAEGAEVSLTNLKTGKKATAKTNNYGDFKIDNLDPDSGKYKLEVQYPGRDKRVVEFELKTSVNLGTISFNAGPAAMPGR